MIYEVRIPVEKFTHSAMSAVEGIELALLGV